MTAGDYTTVVPEKTDIRLHNGCAHYALYPVWLLNTTWNGQQYTFAMNGQTGKFVGDLPVDNKAAWKWRLLLTAVFGAAAFAVAWLLFLMGIL